MPSARSPASTATATPSGGAGCTPTSAVATCWRWWRARRASGDRSRSLPCRSCSCGSTATDWPDDSVKAAARARAKIGLPRWNVKVVSGHRRLLVDVTVPPDASVALGYTDPDGATATCTNSERADAEIVLQRWDDGWHDDRRWSLRGTAHAEVGIRDRTEPRLEVASDKRAQAVERGGVSLVGHADDDDHDRRGDAEQHRPMLIQEMILPPSPCLRRRARRSRRDVALGAGGARNEGDDRGDRAGTR